MLRLLSILFLAGAVLEIASIIWVGSKIGVVSTLLLLLLGSVVGVALFRSAGTNAAAVLKSSIQDQRILESLAGTTMTRLVAGVLFLIPGFFSDLAGLLLLILPMNRWIRVKASVPPGGNDRPNGRSDNFGQVIEGEAVEISGEVTSEREEDS